MVLMLTDQIPTRSELLTYVRCGCKEDGCGYALARNMIGYLLSNLLSVEFCFKS